ncbi:MAG TPA: hypothetical protein VF490_15115 [Chryseosolibacter sp.]
MYAHIKVGMIVGGAALGLLIMCPLPSIAQTEGAILQQIATPEDETSVNGVVVIQNGTANEAYIRQVTTAYSGGIEASQEGNQNRFQLTQAGNYLEVRITQDGSGNFYEGDIEGQDARIDIGQNGSENIIFQSLFVNRSDISIQQHGNENEVVHSGTSSDSGLQIQQEGSGMKLIIQSY